MKVKLITQPVDISLHLTENPYSKRYDGKWVYTLTDIFFMYNGKGYRIPFGFLTDLGSVPRVFRGLVDNDGKSTLAFIIHDWTHKSGCSPKLTRFETDILLYKIARLSGQNQFQAMGAFIGTRIGGFFSKNYKKRPPLFHTLSSGVPNPADCRSKG